MADITFMPQAGGSFFSDPAMVQNLTSALAGPATQAAGQYMGFLQNPAASPLFQQQLTGLLAALAPGEARQRQQLGDVFRGSGNLASSQYGSAASQLIGQQGLNRQTLASQLLGQVFPQMTQALGRPMDAITSLINALKMQQSGQTGGVQSSPSPSILDSILGQYGTSNVKTATQPQGQTRTADPYAALLTALLGSRGQGGGGTTQGGQTYGGGAQGGGGEWVTSPDGSVMQNLLTGEVQLVSNPYTSPGFGPQTGWTPQQAQESIFPVNNPWENVDLFE